MAQSFHLFDQELLRFLDGELSVHEARRVESHLAACWACRLRKQELGAAIGDFVRFHQDSLHRRIPPADGARALLKARLAQVADMERRPGRRSLRWFAGTLRWQITAAALLLAGLSFIAVRDFANRPRPYFAPATVPNPNLTPGATVLFSQRQVCSDTVARNKIVSVTVRRRVFDEYGIRAAEPDAFEIDYLITPALGGADDIRNLWPEPQTSAVWNSEVKDQLEDHLRDLVCDGQLQLATAQRDLAGNWIEAYKKYFHTDRPLAGSRQ